ncbi:MAG: SPFH domain-containing protein [Oscillospiraceae bacterium]|jgi:membrane protease subunit (stomatin/prohibitin family)|nr:SPFH domain-containing protein [Oscillospiraceae bacterium]
MGLIKAAIGATGGTLADQWKEFFTCDALDNATLAVRGSKQTSRRSSNTHGHDNVITSGSGIAVADGQCMLITEQGRIAEVCAEPGAYTYDASSEPSIFCGSLGQGLRNVFSTIGKRFVYGGDTAKDQRVYYFNTKEIFDNKFGTANPVPFRVVDGNIGLDIDVSVRCNGIFTFRIENPLLFYTNVCGNVDSAFRKEQIAETLRADLLNALAPALSKISDLQIRPNQLAGKNMEMRDALQDVLTDEWVGKRGLQILSVSFNSVTVPPEDEELIKQAQRAAMLQNPTYAAATLAAAQADAMRSAAENDAGAMTGFMGMGFAQQAGGANPAQLFGLGAPPTGAAYNSPTPPPTAPAADAAAWLCSCGTENSGKFCTNCGKAKALAVQCAVCGWVLPEGAAKPNFCPNCGAKL